MPASTPTYNLDEKHFEIGGLENISDGCFDSPTFCDGCLLTWDCVCETKGSSDSETSLPYLSRHSSDNTLTFTGSGEEVVPTHIRDSVSRSEERGTEWLQKAWESGHGLVFSTPQLTTSSSPANGATKRGSRPPLTVAIPPCSPPLYSSPKTISASSPDLISPQDFSPLITPKTSSRLCIPGVEAINSGSSNHVIAEHISNSQSYLNLAHERDILLAKIKGLYAQDKNRREPVTKKGNTFHKHHQGSRGRSHH